MQRHLNPEWEAVPDCEADENAPRRRKGAMFLRLGLVAGLAGLVYVVTQSRSTTKEKTAVSDEGENGFLSALSLLQSTDTSVSGGTTGGTTTGWFGKMKRMFFDAIGFGHCDQASCNECLQKDGCRWCPSTQKCHDLGSIEDQCTIPINSEGQCWGQHFAYQLGEFLNNRPSDAEHWIQASAVAEQFPLAPFPTYPAGQTGIFDLLTGLPLASNRGGSPVTNYTIALIADWGTGTAAAHVVAELALIQQPHMTIHMGDVYFTSTPDEFNTNVLGKPLNSQQKGVAFPKGSVTTFLQMGNHELLSGCQGLYTSGFSYTGQSTTYAVWQTDNWRIVSLDTGYLCYSTLEGVRDFTTETDAPMPQEVVDWLTNTVKLGDPSDKRGILLLSHHQPFDPLSSAYPGATNQLNQILPAGKQVIWLYGHNHAFAVFQKMQLQGSNFVMYPRLIGIGGFPNILETPTTAAGIVAYDARTYQAIPDDDGLNQNIGYNGYANVVITGKSMHISYITNDCIEPTCVLGLSSSNGTTIASETFVVNLETGEVDQTASYIGPELTTLNAQTTDVISAVCLPPQPKGNPAANHFD